jgi:trk system potassium uptake protein TrkH
MDEETVSSVFLYIVLYLIVLFLSFVLVLACGLDISEAFSGTIASLGNVGPGLGSIGTMGNYAAMPVAAKFIFTIDMFLGRVEIFPVLIVLSMIGRKDR